MAAMALPSLCVATFRNKTDNKPVAGCLPWPELQTRLTRHTVKPQGKPHKDDPHKDGPLWSPTRYRPDTVRGVANVESLSCFVADVDDGTPLNHLRQAWKGLAWCAASSWSHTPEQPKYRVTFPLARPVPAGDWPAVHRKLALALFGEHTDPACKDASRIYFLPSCPKVAETYAFADAQEGEPLDPDDYPDPDPMDAAGSQMRYALRADDHKMVGGNRSGDNDRPGDDYNARGPVLELLQSAGWQIVGQRGGAAVLRRPGKASDWSANFGFGEAFGGRMFFCFTSSAPPFEPKTGYSPFAVYALLKQRGDFAEAARQLGRAGYGDQTPPAVKRAVQKAAAQTPEDEDAKAADTLADFNPTDAGNAERLIAYRGENLRFVRGLGWRTWNGKFWEAGEEAVIRLSRETVRALFGVAAAMLTKAKTEQDKDARQLLVAKSEELAKHALRSEQTAKLAAMIKQAASFTEITAEPALFHLRPWIVPFANGVWDRGEWRCHKRSDYAERLLPVAYEPDADRREWLALLDRMTSGDAELSAMLQEVAGYAFSGASSLRFLPWFYGPKGTGKSTFAELLQTALGASGKALDWSLVSGDRTGEELGRAVRGARAVFLPEAGKKRLDPEILKLLSGSDSIPCRELYQGESFTVPPTWALVATSNEPPDLTAYDEALKDRVKALPFVHRIAEGEALHFTGGAQRIEQVRRDPESPLVRGFVAWAVEGLARVHRNQAIRTADAAEKQTRRFWTDTDTLTPFWSGLSETGLRAGMDNEALRAAYLAWSNQEGIKKPLLTKAWGNACRAAGLKDYRNKHGRGWRIPEGGLWIYRPEEEPEEAEPHPVTESAPVTEKVPFSVKSLSNSSRGEGLPKTAIILSPDTESVTAAPAGDEPEFEEGVIGDDDDAE